MGSTLCGDYDGFHPLEHASCGQLSRRQRPQLVERDARVLVWSAIARRGNREPYDCGVLGASQHGRRPAGSTEFFARVLRPEGACDEDRSPRGVFGRASMGALGAASRVGGGMFAAPPFPRVAAPLAPRGAAPCASTYAVLSAAHCLEQKSATSAIPWSMTTFGTLAAWMLLTSARVAAQKLAS